MPFDKLENGDRSMNHCKVCGPTHLITIDETCNPCWLILVQAKVRGNTPAREWLHKLNNYIARGVDD